MNVLHFTQEWLSLPPVLAAVAMCLGIGAFYWRGRLRLGQIRWLRPRRRLKVLLQLNMVECGAACLAMVLTYFGRSTTVAECREECDPGRDGLTAHTIARAARRYDLRVKAYSLDAEDFGAVPLPAVVHWAFSHFVVVERWSPKQVVIVDPAVGRRRLSAGEFADNFTGVVLTFAPDAHFARRRADSDAPVWRRYLASLLQTPGTGGLIGQILGASLLLQGLGLALPLFTKVLVDQILPAGSGDLMPILAAGIGLLALTHLVTSYLRAALLLYLQARIDTQLMVGFFEHVLTLPFRFFQQRSSGDLLMRLGSNLILRETLTGQTLAVVLDGFFVLVYLAVLLVQAPGFALLVLGIGLGQVALLAATGHRVHDLAQRDLAAGAASQSFLVEALTGMATLKVSGAEEQVLDHWSNLFFKQLNLALQRNQLAALVDTTLSTVRGFAPLLLLWVAAGWVLAGGMSLGTMLALNMLATAFLVPLASLVANARQLQLAGAHLERLADVLDAQPEQVRLAVQPAPALGGRIELRNVGFRYDANGPWVLRNVSAVIEPGQKVALVGRSGSGKSTLALLLLGLYRPTEGEIRFDGVPLHTLDYRSLRRQIGVVLQESFLFSGSIRRNISFNDPDMPLERVVVAAQLAGLHDEIMAMPMGYETLLSEGGSGLSGGQRQRMSLARALAPRPSLLLLDEATSHLDVKTEAEIERNLAGLACTQIVIAHRLSTVRSADTILVLDQGGIVERGSHHELLAGGGAYAELVQSQVEAERAGVHSLPPSAGL